MKDAPDTSRMSASSLSGTWITPLPVGLVAPTVMRRIESRFPRYSGARRTMIGKCRSLPSSYRSPTDCPPIAAVMVALTSPVARP